MLVLERVDPWLHGRLSRASRAWAIWNHACVDLLGRCSHPCCERLNVRTCGQKPPDNCCNLLVDGFSRGADAEELLVT